MKSMINSWLGWMAVTATACGAAGKSASGASMSDLAGHAAQACFAESLPPLTTPFVASDCNDDDSPSACANACHAGDAMACWARALVLQMAPTRDKSEDAELRELFHDACALGLPIGCTNYAATQWAAPQPDDREGCAIQLFDLSCDAKEKFACGMAGRLRVDAGGDLVEPGRQVLERSCSEVGGFPCRILALKLEEGLLGPVPDGRVRALLAAACAGGDDPSCGEPATAAETFNAP